MTAAERSSGSASDAPRPTDASCAGPRCEGLGRADAVAFASLWLVYAALVQRFWFVIDDAYITFRYSKNWGSGLGLRFNPGAEAPVEGYTNFSVMALGALFQRLGLAIDFWVPLTTALTGSILLWVVYRLIRVRIGASLPVACLATGLLAGSAQFAVWSTSGMETMPYTLFLLLAVERLILAPERMRPLSAGIFATLLALTRAEGICWAVVIGLLAALSRRARGERVGRPLLQYFGVLAVLFSAYYAWRFTYFGLPLPMTVYAKMRPSEATLARGLDYVAAQYLSSLSLLVVVPGCLVALRRGRRTQALAVAAMPVGIALYSILVGGDFMTFGRFLVPALPFNALLAAWLLMDLRRPTLVWSVGAALVVLAALPGFDLHPVPHSWRERFHFRLNTTRVKSEYEHWKDQRWNAIHWRALADALNAIARPGDSLVTGAVGVVGFATDLFLYDRHGLVTAEVGLMPSAPQDNLRTPGHDHGVTTSYFVARGYEPTFIEARCFRLDGDDPSRKLLRWRDDLLADPFLAQRYVFDFFELRAPGSDAVDERPYHFIVWRRIEGDPARAWQEVETRLAAFTRGGGAKLLRVSPPERPAGRGEDDGES